MNVYLHDGLRIVRYTAVPFMSMKDDARIQAVIDALGEQPGETLTPTRLEAIQTAMHEDLGRFVDATSYFVLGSYGPEERPTLEAVRDQLGTDAAADGDDTEVDAFLMDDIHDVSEFFTSKFKLLVSYADHIVGVYEHSQGGHAWEAGYIDQPTSRAQTRVFYKVYDTKEAQYDAYDGMFAHYLLSMERVNRAYAWETTDDLLAIVQATYDHELLRRCRSARRVRPAEYGYRGLPTANRVAL